MPDFARPAGLQALTGLVRDCSIANIARRVLLLRSDLLPKDLARSHHLRLAEEALEPLATAERARRFALSHGRIAISWRGDAPERLRRALDGLEHLLADAPLDTPGMPELARIFDLPADGAALLALAADLPADEQPAFESGESISPQDQPARPALDPAMLESMDQALSRANVARFVRRQMVCRMGMTHFSPAWERRHLLIGELASELAPGRDPYADRWLFLKLTRMIDRRLLALLSTASELLDAGPFSIDLSLDAVLSSAFLKFDAALPARLRGQVVLNVQAADALTDLPAYRFARAFARCRKYRFMLRGLTPALLPVLDVAALEVDFAELRWSQSLVGLNAEALQPSVRWVLSHARDEDALRWGKSAGIGLFQGESVQPDIEHGLGKPHASVRSAG